MNLSFMKNKEVQFVSCDFSNASILETRLNQTSFDDCQLRQCEFLHSSLYKVDLSTCQLDGILISPQDIQGAIIDSYQSSSLIHLLKVSFKQ